MKLEAPRPAPNDSRDAEPPRAGRDAAAGASGATVPQDWRLTTAELLYHLPDRPSILQSFVWQALDVAPHYPALRRFLDFWAREIEGKLHSVRVGETTLLPARAGGLH